MTDTKTNPPAGWDNILQNDEKILWQGTPEAGIQFEPKKMIPFIFGLFFAGFALFWMIMAASAGGLFWMFGLIHFTVGNSMSVGAFLWPAFMARRTWYTLTNQRAFIATTSVFGTRKLDSYPVTKDTDITTTLHRYMTINFASERRRGNKGRSYTKHFGFRDLADGDTVFKLMRAIQKDAL